MNKCCWLHEILDNQTLHKHPFSIKTLPPNAIYFFYESGEVGHDSSNKQRIVRIGTARQNNFGSRIYEHFLIDERKLIFNFYQSKPSDRSIFRKNIGRAILNKKNDGYLPIWDIDFTSLENRKKYGETRDINKEQAVEKEISKILRDTFSFRFMIIEDESQRMGHFGLENRLIGTVSKCSRCGPSTEWLGNYSPIIKIKSSGLWQTQHLWSEEINDMDIEKIKKSIMG